MKTPSTAPPRRPLAGWLPLTLACLGLVLAVLFADAFKSGLVHFSNDTPLAVHVADYLQFPSAWKAVWGDISWLGWNGGSMFPGIGSTLLWLLGPVGYAKFIVPLSMLLTGVCAAWCMTQLRLGTPAAVLCGIAAGLNSNFLSNGCWGLTSRPLQFAMIFLAIGAIAAAQRSRTWLRLAFAGGAIGLNIVEGADVGAILSLYMAAFLVLLALGRKETPLRRRLLIGGAGSVLMAVMAAWVSWQTLSTVINLQIKGVAGASDVAQTQESAGQKWDWATQWSLPKAEGLRVIIPGLFGYRLDTEKGGAYWGAVGQQPGWEQHKQGFPRHSGSGEYAGMLVAVVGLWAALQGFRREGGAFDAEERRIVKFWTVAALVSLLFAFGRHAPFYQLVYALPYFSTIRNPMKFMHPFHVALILLFGFGVKGLCRLYLEQTVTWAGSPGRQIARWWNEARGFDKYWASGALGVFCLFFMGWMIYSAGEKALAERLKDLQFPPEMSGQMAAFSVGEVGAAAVVLALCLVLLALIMSGCFSGARARWAVILCGLFLSLDLARASTPWIRFYDYKAKYASNPVVDYLRDKPHERRVAVLPLNAGPDFAGFQQFYNVEWLQQHFVYYNIQSLDYPQAPRKAHDQDTFERRMSPDPTNFSATLPRLPRYWQITNTRLIFAPGGATDQLNQLLDPQQKRFRQVLGFSLGQTGPGTFTSQINPGGPFGLYELQGALPRAALFHQWTSGVSDADALSRLADPSFDPLQGVLVADAIASKPPAAPAKPGTVEFTSYSPKRIRLKVQSEADGILLLNDRYDPAWRARLDGAEVPVLRCNFAMRGVEVPAGAHEVELEFRPVTNSLFVTLAGLAAWALLAVVAMTGPGRKRADETAPASANARP